VVSATDPNSRVLDFLDRHIYIQIAKYLLEHKLSNNGRNRKLSTHRISNAFLFSSSLTISQTIVQLCCVVSQRGN
jgi:hypothetical protein